MGLQETGSKEYMEIVQEGSKIINFGEITNQYRGMAFYVSEEWCGRIITTKLISDRIAVIRFDLGKEGQLAVVNVYGPTGVVTRENPEKGREFYDQVQEVYVREKFKSSMVII